MCPRWVRCAIAVGSLVVTLLPPVANASPTSIRAPGGVPALPGTGPVGAWKSIGVSPHPDGREQHVMVSAPELNAVIVFGGYTSRHIDDDLWVLDLGAGEWRHVIPTGDGPGPRASQTGIWDPVGRRVVLFGGVTFDGATPLTPQFHNDVWAIAFDPAGTSATWQLLHQGGALDPAAPLNALVPPARAWHTASFDPVARRMLVYGGLDLATLLETNWGSLVDNLQRPFTQRWLLRYALGDAWSFDLSTSTWTLLSDAGIRRYAHQAVYDPVNRQLVATGGFGPPADGGSWYRPETESLDPSSRAWTRWSPAGASPAFRDPAFAYSPSLGALLVMGSDRPSDPQLSSRYVHALILGAAGEGAEWGQLPANRPLRSLLGMRGVAVGTPERFVIMGGYLGGSVSALQRAWKLWGYDLVTRRWERSLPGVEPLPSIVLGRGVVDPSENALYTVGSSEGGPPWRLDLTTGRWAPTGEPGEAPLAGKIVHDPVGGRMFLIEGCMHRVWVMEPGDGWRAIEPAGDVVPVCAPLVAFDPPRRRLLMMGGYHHHVDDGASVKNRLVFALELPPGEPARWEELDPSGSGEVVAIDPVYDPFGDRLITYTETGKVQALDFSGSRDGRWEAVPVEGQGSPQVFDVANNRALMYRCSDGTLHALDLDGDRTWRQVETSNDPPRRCLAAVAYDPVGKRLLIHGGYADGVPSNDTFALGLGGSLAPPSRPSEPIGPPPAPVPAMNAGTWRTLGPSHAFVMDVDFATTGDARALAATSAITNYVPRAAGVFASVDGGRTWSPTGGDTAGAPMTEIAQSPAEPDRIYAASVSQLHYGLVQGTGMYVSEDGGRSWRRSDRGLPWDSYWAVAAHPIDPLVAWAGGERGGVYRTDDGGTTWHEVARDQLDGLWVNALAAVPTPTGVRVLAGVRQADSGGLTGDGGVFYSDDLGESWDLGFETVQFVKALAVDPSDPRRVVAAEGDGVWRSDDFGATWEHVNGDTWQNRTGEEVHLGSIEFDPSSGGGVLWGGGLIYPCDFTAVGGGSAAPPATPGIWKSTDGGGTWAKVQGPPADDEYCGLAVSSDGRSLLASGWSSGLWRSDDGGTTWHRSDSGIAHDRVSGAAAHPLDPDTVVAALPDGGVYVTRDGGATWRADGTGHGAAYHVVAVPGAPGRFLATAGETVRVSDDGGDTWRGTAVNAWGYAGYSGGLATDPTDPDTWYFTSRSGSPMEGWKFGIGVTRDNGATWRFSEVRAAGVPAPCPRSIVVDPFAPARVYVADGCGAGVYRSEDRGETWSRVGPSVGEGYVTALAADPSREGRLWAGTQHFGVYRSDDAGETWEPARDGIGFRDVRGLAVVGERVFAATLDHGVFATDDQGANWSPAMDGSPVRSFHGLAVGPGGRVLAGTGAGGVLELEGGPS